MKYYGNMRNQIFLLLLSGTLVFGGCASTPKPPPVDVTEGDVPIPVSSAPEVDTPTAPLSNAITLDMDADILSVAVREAGLVASGGGLVLMNGLGTRMLPPIAVQRESFDAYARRLAALAELKLHAAPGYTLLYAEGYESLAALSLDLPAEFDKVRISAAFGEGTLFYNVLAVLGLSTGLTLVADNLLAEVPVGELLLSNLPLDQALVAILQSARMAAGMYVVEHGDGYVFLRGVENHSRPNPLLNPGAVAGEVADRLNRRVSFILPEPRVADGNKTYFHDRAYPLGRLLPALEKHLGIAVECPAAMRDFPVNYTVIRNLPARTALDLIVRQWLAPGVGYRVGERGIVFGRE